MSCRWDKENPVNEDEDFLTADLFPLAVGRIFVYTTYELDTTTGQKVASTTHRDASLIQVAVTVGGRIAYRLIDSIYLGHSLSVRWEKKPVHDLRNFTLLTCPTLLLPCQGEACPVSPL